MKYDPTSAGSYSISDEGCRGDLFAVSPATYPVPGYLREYDDLRKALNVAVDTCALQQGTCWVIKRSNVLPRCGQRCGRGECENCGPGRCSGGLAGHERVQSYSDPVRREVAAGWAQEWQKVARVTPDGVSLVKDGCTLPLWQRLFFVVGENNDFRNRFSSLTYRAAVAAAMRIARDQGQTRIVGAQAGNGRTVPVVYVEPGGIVRAHRRERDSAVQVRRMDEFEMRQALAASRGGSIMPFNM